MSHTWQRMRLWNRLLVLAIVVDLVGVVGILVMSPSAIVKAVRIDEYGSAVLLEAVSMLPLMTIMVLIARHFVSEESLAHWIQRFALPRWVWWGFVLHMLVATFFWTRPTLAVVVDVAACAVVIAGIASVSRTDRISGRDSRVRRWSQERFARGFPRGYVVAFGAYVSSSAFETLSRLPGHGYDLALLSMVLFVGAGVTFEHRYRRLHEVTQ